MSEENINGNVEESYIYRQLQQHLDERNMGKSKKSRTEFAVQYALNYAAEKFRFKTELWAVRSKKVSSI